MITAAKDILAKARAAGILESVAEKRPLPVVVVNIATKELVAWYNTLSEFTSASKALFGDHVGYSRFHSIIAKGGILNARSGTYLISVTGIDL